MLPVEKGTFPFYRADNIEEERCVQGYVSILISNRVLLVDYSTLPVHEPKVCSTYLTPIDER